MTGTLSDYTFIADVDGVLSTGQFLYSAASGKKFKIFGPDDALALQRLALHCDVVCVSGDKRGWDITKRRLDDIKIKLMYAPSSGRLAFLSREYDMDRVIYMGDSFTDIRVAENAALSICPHNAFYALKDRVNHVCEHDGGMRAVAEAVFYVYEKFGMDVSELID